MHKAALAVASGGLTSSSAIAKRPRDASCLSVVSFNSTKRRVKYFIVSYVGYRFVTALRAVKCAVLLSLAWRWGFLSFSSSSPAINTAAYYQQCVITCERPRLQHLAYCSVNTGSQARYRLIIAISAYPTCIRRPRYGRFPSEYCYAVWHGKTRMAWLPEGEKKLMIRLVVLTQLTNVTDGQTH